MADKGKAGFSVSRRRLLGGIIAAPALAGAVAVQNSGAEEASEQSAGQGQSPRSFEGEHQPGVDANPQRIGLVVACDVQVSTHAELRELFKTLTERLRRLHAGGRIEPDGVVTPARDSGELGTDIDPEDLSITVGVGRPSSTTDSGWPTRSPPTWQRCGRSPTTCCSRNPATATWSSRSARITRTR